MNGKGIRNPNNTAGYERRQAKAMFRLKLAMKHVRSGAANTVYEAIRSMRPTHHR